MESNELCPLGTVFVEDDRYELSRYEAIDGTLFMKVWTETFKNSPVYEDEGFKRKSWEDVNGDSSKLHLKIVDKVTREYIGEVSLVGVDTKTPELGIQLLKSYQGCGIGTRIMKLFVEKLKMILQIDYFLIRIFSDNAISQKMFEKLGAIKIGEEGTEHAKLMQTMMKNMGREKFESIIQGRFEDTQKYILCYRLD